MARMDLIMVVTAHLALNLTRLDTLTNFRLIFTTAKVAHLLVVDREAGLWAL